MRLAYFSPLNPQRTGIADYSEELLPYLARYAEIDLFVDGYTPTNREITARYPVYDYGEFEALRASRRYDTALYQMGNSPAHEYIYRTLSRFPGITVLHDYILHHFLVETTVARGDAVAYIREVGYCHGPAGTAAAREALAYGNRFPYLRYPANRRVLDTSVGVIVHSRYVESLLATTSPQTPVAVVNHHISPVDLREPPSALRRELALNMDDLLFASFGLATPEKRLNVALRAFRRVRQRYPRARYLIVGDASPSPHVQQLVQKLDLQDAVVCTGYVEKDDFLRYIAAVDVCVSLRWPTMGETSGSVLRQLAAGKATIVSNVGWYAEIPDDCCRKVPVGSDEEERLAEVMMELAADPVERGAVGRRAQEHVSIHHAIERSAAQYIALIERMLG